MKVISLELKLNGAQPIRTLADVKSALSRLKKEAQTLELGSEALEQNQAAQAELLSIQKQQRAETTKQVKAIKDQSSSYRALSARLGTMRTRYKDLAASEKESTKEAKELREEITKLDKKLKDIDKSVGQNQRNIGNYSSAFDGLKGKLLSLVGPVAIFTAIGAGITKVIGDANELSKELEGVNFAFERIGGSAEVLENVRSSTRGLLSDLDIKKAVVEFDNFGLEIEELPELLEFVSVRAAQTGKSFDSLKDSLVEGLSKESKLRIDNLGISTAELNAQLEKTPDFLTAVSEIAKTEIAEAGNILDEAASSQEKMNVAYQNFVETVADSGSFDKLKNLFFDLSTNVIQAGDNILSTIDVVSGLNLDQIGSNLPNILVSFFGNDEDQKSSLKFLEDAKKLNEEIEAGLKNIDGSFTRVGAAQGRRGGLSGLGANFKSEEDQARASIKSIEDLQAAIQKQQEVVNSADFGSDSYNKANQDLKRLQAQLKEWTKAIEKPSDLKTIAGLRSEISRIQKEISNTSDQNEIKTKLENIASLKTRLDDTTKAVDDLKKAISRANGDDLQAIADENLTGNFDNEIFAPSFQDSPDFIDADKGIEEATERAGRQIELAKDAEATKTKIAEDAIAKRLENEKNAAEERNENLKRSQAEAEEIVEKTNQKIADAFGNLFGNEIANKIKNFLDQFQKDGIIRAEAIADVLSVASALIADHQRNSLEERIRREVESTDAIFQSRIEAAEGDSQLRRALTAEREEEKKKIEKEAAKERKKIAIKEAIIQTALGVIQAIPNPFLMAFAAISGALQLATINSTSFFDGGFTGKSKAKKDSSGGRPTHDIIENSGTQIVHKRYHENEYVVNDRVLKSPEAQPHIRALEAMRKKTKGSYLGKSRKSNSFMEGGFTGAAPSYKVLGSARAEISEESINMIADKIGSKVETGSTNGTKAGIRSAQEQSILLSQLENDTNIS